MRELTEVGKFTENNLGGSMIENCYCENLGKTIKKPTLLEICLQDDKHLSSNGD